MNVLEDGYTRVPAGKIATVVTCFEMHHPPPSAPVTVHESVERVWHPSVEWYRDVYARVGREWLWFSRLRLSATELSSILTDPRVEVFAIHRDGVAEGLLELDFRQEGECELAFIGMTAALRGRGLGQALMQTAIARAFARPISRFWVHTCTLDHPKAVAFYLGAGFQVYERRVEVADDPRLTGEAPLDVQPHVPIIRPA